MNTPKQSVAPVFLLSSERSGSNLLRKLITQHQQVYYGPPPAHFLKHHYHNQPYYGDSLRMNGAGFRHMVEDALKLCFVHSSPWKISFDVEDVIERYQTQYVDYNPIFLSDFLMEEYAKSQGYTSYFCKDNHLFEFAFAILRFLPEAKFIYLCRDPRDYTLSQKKRTLQTDSIRRIAKLWRDEQIKCLSALTCLPAKQTHFLKYEELVANTQEVMQRLCDFLGVEFLIRPAETAVVTGTVVPKEWDNLSKPVMSDNFNKFESELSKREILNIEGIAEPQMKVLGYPLTTNTRDTNLVYRMYDEYGLHVFSYLRRKWLSDPRDNWSRSRNAMALDIRRRRIK